MNPRNVPCLVASAFLLLLFLWNLRRLARPGRSFLDHPVCFLALVFPAMLVLRWPTIAARVELNADESQMIAQAMRFLSHPVPWRDVDGTTSGPLNSMWLSVPMFFGAPATWQTARMVLWVSICLTLVFLYFTLRHYGGDREVQLVLMPVIFFYAFAHHWDFTHYTSETLPVLLLAACLFLLSRFWRAGRTGKLELFLLGLLVGSVPFAKLQAAPLGGFMAFAGLLLAWRANRPSLPWREWTSLCLGGLLMSLLILVPVAANGAWGDFWKSYILSSANYAHASLIDKSDQWIILFLRQTDFTACLMDLAAAMLLLWLSHRARKSDLPNELVWPLRFIVAGGVLTLICIALPGKDFNHYQLLLVPMMALFLGWTFFACKAWLKAGVPGRESGAPPSSPANRWLPAGILLVVAIQLFRLNTYFLAPPPAKPRPVWVSTVQRVMDVSRPGDTMSIWGWMPSYYVATGLAPATRDAIGHYILTPGPYQDYYRRRYLNDLQQSRPPVFLDAVATGSFFFWDISSRHECFPELARFIQENYTLCPPAKPESPPGPRVYLLNERWARLKAG